MDMMWISLLISPVVWVDICNDCKEHCTPVDLEERELMDTYRDVGMSPSDFI